VLEEFQVPAVFFVIGEIFQNPDYVPWYVEIKHLLRKTEARKVSYNNIEFKLKTKEDRERFKAHLYDSFKKCRSEKERQNFLNNISRLLKIDRPYAHELDEDLQFINKDDVKIVNSSKLLTVASHAMTHRLLETLSYEEQQNELANSNLLLKEYFSSYYPVISYPDGSFNHDTIIIAKKIYEFGFAVLLGSSYLNWFAYPRICLENNTIQNLSYIFSPLRTNLVLPLKRALHKIEVFKSRLVSNLQKCQVSK
jgi:peptidoglycan/xylan/chitin deacetylase (PgdA/CDA1 family)